MIKALGGLIVGLVTKYAGGVKKGFALIAGVVFDVMISVKIMAVFVCAGIALTGLVSWILEGKPLFMKDWYEWIMLCMQVLSVSGCRIAMALVSISIYLHSSYPYRAPKRSE